MRKSKIIYSLLSLILISCGNGSTLTQDLGNAVGNNESSKAIFNLECFRDTNGDISQIRFVMLDDPVIKPVVFSYTDDLAANGREKIITCEKTQCWSPTFGGAWTGKKDYSGGIRTAGNKIEADIGTDLYRRPKIFSIEGTSCP